MIKHLAFLLIVFSALFSFGQSKMGNWQAYILNTKFGESPVRFQMDIQHRDHNLIGDLDQTIFRPGIQYFHAQSKSSYLMGYAFFVFQNEGNPNVTVTENRIFQDIDLRHSIGRVGIRHRYRFEERFVEAQPFAFRLRYAIFINIPIKHKSIVAKTLYIPIWNEVFINAKGTPFDRNWLYAGLGYRITDSFGVQLGLMDQFRVTGPKAQIVLSPHHDLSLGVKTPTNQ